MQSRLKSKTIVMGTVLCFLLEIFFLSAANPAFARQDHRRSGHGIDRPGHVVDRLPNGHHTTHLGQRSYFYHGGIFYRKRPKGFIVVRPPVGAVIDGLPVGFTTAVIAGTTYFLFASAFYRPVRAGYMVVEPEVPAGPTTSADFNVSVTAELLNVRAQPGMEHGIITRVCKSTVLTVQGQAPGWLYVNLPDGKYGWVMARYTRRLLPPANG